MFLRSFRPSRNRTKALEEPRSCTVFPVGSPWGSQAARLEEVEGEAIPRQDFGGPLRLLVHVFVIQVPPGHRKGKGMTNFLGGKVWQNLTNYGKVLQNMAKYGKHSGRDLSQNRIFLAA